MRLSPKPGAAGEEGIAGVGEGVLALAGSDVGTAVEIEGRGAGVGSGAGVLRGCGWAAAGGDTVGTGAGGRASGLACGEGCASGRGVDGGTACAPVPPSAARIVAVMARGSRGRDEVIRKAMVA